MSRLTLPRHPRKTFAFLFGLAAAGAVDFWFGWPAVSPANARGPKADPPESLSESADVATAGTTVAGADRTIIYDADGLTPVYIEDPVDRYGIPIPLGPQHRATAARGSLLVRRVPNLPPRPAGSPRPSGGAFNLVDGSTLMLEMPPDEPDRKPTKE